MGPSGWSTVSKRRMEDDKIKEEQEAKLNELETFRQELVIN